jgi:hypothetical protein
MKILKFTYSYLNIFNRSKSQNLLLNRILLIFFNLGISYFLRLDGYLLSYDFYKIKHFAMTSEKLSEQVSRMEKFST